MSVPARKPGVAIYARAAAADQRNDPVNSQLDRLRAFVAAAIPRQPAPAEYVEHHSGLAGLADRPEGRRLLHDARAGRFGVVYVTTQDRISRRPAALLASLRELDRAGVYVIALDGSIDTHSPEGREWLRLLADMIGDSARPPLAIVQYARVGSPHQLEEETR